MTLGAIGCSGTSAPAPEPFVFGVAPATAAHFKKGINLGNRLDAPNEGDWGGVIQAEDFLFDAAFLSRVDTVLDVDALLPP